MPVEIGKMDKALTHKMVRTIASSPNENCLKQSGEDPVSEFSMNDFIDSVIKVEKNLPNLTEHSSKESDKYFIEKNGYICLDMNLDL